MSELQTLEGHQTNGGFNPSSELPETSSIGSKRLRRPSVRLGDIGGGGGSEEQYQHVPYESHVRRPNWRPTSNKKETKLTSRTRTLTNLSSGYETLDEDPNAIGSMRVNNWVKSGGETKAKRVRSNWVEEDDEVEEGRDFSREESESPVEEENLRRRRGGVKSWLQELGLVRYWPMFEMHEVDEQVLSMLTLEDLKDMGINAVGSRRKMYSAIQKLGRDMS